MIEISLTLIALELFLVILLLYRMFKKNSMGTRMETGRLFRKLGSHAYSVVEAHNHKYKNTGLSEKLRMEYKTKLENWFIDEKPYLNPNLKLKDVAEQMNLSINQASQLINQSFSLDFNTYVNRHRIEYAIGLFEHVRFKYISDVIYESGFNNAATFNNAFKKFTGKTPSRFISQLQKSQSNHKVSVDL